MTRIIKSLMVMILLPASALGVGKTVVKIREAKKRKDIMDHSLKKAQKA